MGVAGQYRLHVARFAHPGAAVEHRTQKIGGLVPSVQQLILEQIVHVQQIVRVLSRVMHQLFGKGAAKSRDGERT